MANWTEVALATQFQRAKQNGWLAYFESAAAEYGFEPEFLMAIASRETNMQNIKGDLRNGVYHGFGIMQVDVGSNPDFCSSWTADNVQGSIECGAKMLAAKRAILAHRSISDLRAIAAAYNTGEGNVIHSVNVSLDVDHTTTGGDYGQDVLNRMVVFVKLRQPTPVSTPQTASA